MSYYSEIQRLGTPKITREYYYILGGGLKLQMATRLLKFKYDSVILPHLEKKRLSQTPTIQTRSVSGKLDGKMTLDFNKH